MEEVIQKLSEIETTAQGIMNEAEKQKAALTDELNKKIQDYDAKVESESSEKIAQIRKSLEDHKEAELANLNKKTQDILTSLDQYYQKNHNTLSQDIFDKILKG